MEDLGMIQNVDHNGEEEDDDDEMSFIQEPKTLLVIESSKGLMHPMHFSEGGNPNEPGESEPASPAEGPSQGDADQASDPAETGTAEAEAAAAAAAAAKSAAKDMATLEYGVTNPGLFGTGLTAENMAKQTTPGRALAAIGAIAGALTDTFQGLEKEGVTVDFPGEDDYSGFGKGEDIGGDDGSRGGGGDDLNTFKAALTPETPKITTSVRRYIPGVGIIDTAPKRGIMRAANGGMAYVPGVGLLGTAQEALVEAGSGSTEPLSFDKFTADVFGLGQVPNVDTLGAEKALEEFTANKYKEYETQPPLSGQDLKNRNTLAREVTPSRVTAGDQSAEASKEYAKDKELRRILINRGVDASDFAQVISDFSQGKRQILSSSSPLENEQLIAELGALGNSRRISREGVDAKDIPEGATNRDALKGIFAPQISSMEKYDSRNRGITKKESLIQNILTSDKLGEEYEYNLDDPADPSTLNKIVNFANTSTFSPEYTPKSKGLMSASPTSQPPEGNFIPGVGLV
jgi:hypothetical protein